MPRLDVWLVENGHFSSRQVAKRAIKEGMVIVDGKQCKPSKKMSGDEEIVISPDWISVILAGIATQIIDELLEENLVSR